jgi:hypothetical protein
MPARDLIGMSIAALAKPATWSPSVDITIPVYNEERDLVPAVRRLHNYLNTDFPFSAQITIADNASTDGTWSVRRASRAGGLHVGFRHDRSQRSDPFGRTGHRGGGGGGFLNATRPGSQVVAMLKANSSQYSWVAATVNANSAAGYQIATGDRVMAIGGFNGSDPTPTLAQFEALVNAGQIHYYIAGGGGLGSGSGSTGGEIATWVSQHFAAATVDGVTIYDLTAPSS